jgi:hypothetical protein
MECKNWKERAETAEASNQRLREALLCAKTRYSRNHGMPNPTEPFPFEVVFTMPQWKKVQQAMESSPSPTDDEPTIAPPGHKKLQLKNDPRTSPSPEVKK